MKGHTNVKYVCKRYNTIISSNVTNIIDEQTHGWKIMEEKEEAREHVTMSTMSF